MIVCTLFLVIIVDNYIFGTTGEFVNDSNCAAICFVQIHLDNRMSIRSYRNVACITDCYQFESIGFSIDFSQCGSVSSEAGSTIYVVTLETQRVSSVFTCFFRNNVVQVEDRIELVTVLIPFYTVYVIGSAGSRSYIKRTVSAHCNRWTG